jgi:hypothetical protein
MTSSLEVWHTPTKIYLITSCSICVKYDKGRFCNQNKKQGFCVFTKIGKSYGTIGLMERLTALELEKWCNEEITVSGAPQQ